MTAADARRLADELFREAGRLLASRHETDPTAARAIAREAIAADEAAEELEAEELEAAEAEHAARCPSEPECYVMHGGAP